MADTCCVFNRRCWSFDMADRHEIRPEIEHHWWDPERLVWPVKSKEKPELIIAGTGASGIMKPDQSLEEELNSRSIEFLALPTGDAAEMYNSIYKERRVGACLHLTC